MYIRAETLDDLLAKVFRRLLVRGARIEPTKGPATELSGMLLKLDAPRARLSRTEGRGILFSCLGEWLWYLKGTNRLDFIQYYLSGYDRYSDDKRTIYGGYGPRIFGDEDQAQIHRVIDLLKSKPDSRQAVVQIFDRKDLLEEHLDIPCTCTLQFMIRDRRLNMLTSMRSNDAYLGLPHDIFAFTMLQELVARSIGVELGHYKHFVGSLHLYERDFEKARAYLEEGWQPRIPMPPMPEGIPWPAIARVLRCEAALRRGRPVQGPISDLPPYWQDLIRVLQIFALSKKSGHQGQIKHLKSRMSSEVYGLYIRKRIGGLVGPRDQLEIFEDHLA